MKLIHNARIYTLDPAQPVVTALKSASHPTFQKNRLNG